MIRDVIIYRRIGKPTALFTRHKCQSNLYITNVFLTLQTQPDPQLDPSGGEYPNRTEIPKKLAAFEKLVRHAMSRFSSDRVNEILRFVQTQLQTKENAKVKERMETTTDQQKMNGQVELGENDETDPEKINDGANVPNQDQTQQKPTVIRISRFKQVEDFINTLESTIEPERRTDKENRILKLYVMFEKDLKYLKDSQEYFDKNIHWRLLEDFYDPDDGFDLKRAEKAQAASDKTMADQPTPDDPPISSGKLRKKKQKKGTNKPPPEDDRFLLGKAVWGLKDVLNKWEKLVGDAPLEEKDFDPDSQYELAQYGNCSNYDLVLRLVPDIFTKCYRAVEFARDWLKLAEKVYRGRLPLRTIYSKDETLKKEKTIDISREETVPTPISHEEVAKKYQQEINDLESKMQEVAIVLKRHETELVKLTAEMNKLQKIDERVERLTTDFEQMDSQIENAQKMYSKCLYEREQAVGSIGDTASGTHLQLERIKKARELEIDLGRRHSEISMLEYRKSMIQEDYLLELELRPNFVYFMGDVESKMLDIKLNMDSRESEKAALEQQLVAMKTTTSRMREEAQRYIDTEETRLSFAMSDITDTIHEVNGTDQSMVANSRRTKTDTSLITSDSSGTFCSSPDDVELNQYLKIPEIKSTRVEDKQQRKVVASDGQRNWYQSQGSRKSSYKKDKFNHKNGYS